MSRWRTWRTVFGWGWQAAPGKLVATAMLLSGGAVTSVLYPVALALVVNASVRHHAQQLIFAVAGLAALYTLTWVLAMLAGTAASQLSDRTAFFLSARIAAQLNAVSGIDHLERPAYRTELDLLRENLPVIASGARQMLVLLAVVVRMAGIMVVLGLVDPVLVALPLCAVAPVLGERVSVTLRQRSEERVAARRRLADALFALATSPGPAKELRVFGVADPLRDRHRALGDAVSADTTRATVLGGLCAGAGWLLFAGAFVAGIAVVVISAAHGHASVGEVVLAVTLFQRAQLQVGQAAAAIGQLLTTVRGAERMLWLEHYAVADAAAAVKRRTPPARLQHGIALNHVRFAYPPDGATVLDGVSLALPAGSAVALVGENGAGKTTLVKLLTGMYRPSAGDITVDGASLADLDLAAWRARTAATFQDFVAFELIAQEAVGVGDLPRLNHGPAVGLALKRAGATAVLGELRDGLQTPLGRSFSHGQDLSGGQWQRLALARGMMREQPLLLILDEPTASLDALTEAALFERYLAARSLARASGAITLFVSHRFSTVRMADLIVVLESGRVSAVGDHASLMRDGGLYAELYDLQASAYR